jgi:hypothetical protein
MRSPLRTVSFWLHYYSIRRALEVALDRARCVDCSASDLAVVHRPNTSNDQTTMDAK